MFVITGATGQLGSRIVERLLRQVPAERVAVSVREPAKAGALAERGVRVRGADFTDPASLRDAFEGAEQVLVVSAAIRGADEAVAANTAALDAAKAAGAKRILYTSHQAASRDSLFGAAQTHARTEEHLAGLGVPFTALRNGYYATAIGLTLGGVRETGRLALPADGPFSWTWHDDLADVAVAALTTDGLFDGATPPLTAPEALDFEGVAAVVGEVLGRTVTRVVVSDEEWAAASGLPPAAAEFMLGMFRAARRGEFAVTDPTLETVLGRPATRVRTVLERLLQA
ncbi:NAD(P)H-binding protein [Cryptosporangium arvum]|uniref:Putative nucleoside-diphosphate sugar epimerase n=1 Tax=Cryptosporangium arvum DSM 44712 TaxID=927661 RepID=A0A010ZT20_9ACTN|nr:NAD(P)H-binding protein [Cryptosporangium arvum]EXG81834.1 putative nucleoside-diphosphate sugar epimerase [Cryptosporangium arvum DSM 44712]